MRVGEGTGPHRLSDRLRFTVAAGIALSFGWLIFWYPWGQHSLTILRYFARSLDACASPSWWTTLTCSLTTDTFFGGLFRPVQILIGYVTLDRGSGQLVPLFIPLRLAIWGANAVLLYYWGRRMRFPNISALLLALLWSTSSIAVWYTAGVVNLTDLALCIGLSTTLAAARAQADWQRAIIFLPAAVVALGMARTETLLIAGLWYVSLPILQSSRRFIQILLGGMLIGLVLANLQESGGRLALSAIHLGHLFAVASLPASVCGLLTLAVFVPVRYRGRTAVVLLAAGIITSGEFITDPGRSDMLFFSADRTVLLFTCWLVTMGLLYWRPQLRRLWWAGLVNYLLIVVAAGITHSAMNDPSPRNFPLLTLLFCSALASVLPGLWAEMRSTTATDGVLRRRSGAAEYVGVILILLSIMWHRAAVSAVILQTFSGASELEHWEDTRHSNFATSHCLDVTASNLYIGRATAVMGPGTGCTTLLRVNRPVPRNVDQFWRWASGDTYYNLLSRSVARQVQPEVSARVLAMPLEISDLRVGLNWYELWQGSEVRAE